MPIYTKHPEYEQQLPKVSRVRDCFEGSDAVKAKAEEYLPRLDEQPDTKYNAYKKRGFFLPVVKSTIVAFIGAIMRKDPVVEVPEVINYLIKDTDGNGRTLALLASKIIGELNQSGRSGILTEHNGERPIFVMYKFEQIINRTPKSIVLSQSYDIVDPKDKFKITQGVEYLELTFDEDGFYIQNLWRKESKSWKIIKTITPTKRGKKLDFIPFSIANTLELSWATTDPAVLEIADVDLDHYRLSTDLRHGLHYTALPTMFLFGEMKDEKGHDVAITVGAGSANHINDSDGRAELLEFTGAGLGAINTAIDKDTLVMANLGAKMLQNPTSGVRSAETSRIEASGESATLSTIANVTEAQLIQCMGWALDWEGSTGDVSVKLNRDFLDTKLDPQMLSALLSTYHGGGMSLDSFLNTLFKGEIIPADRTIEEEKELIEKDNEGVDLDDDEDDLDAE